MIQISTKIICHLHNGFKVQGSRFRVGEKCFLGERDTPLSPLSRGEAHKPERRGKGDEYPITEMKYRCAAIKYGGVVMGYELAVMKYACPVMEYAFGANQLSLHGNAILAEKSGINPSGNQIPPYRN